MRIRHLHLSGSGWRGWWAALRETGEGTDGKEPEFIETDGLWAASPRTPAIIKVIPFSFFLFNLPATL